MAVTRDQKAVQLKDLQEKFDSAQSVIFTNYIGLTVAEVTELRRNLKKAGAEMKVAKKTIVRIAAEGKKLPIPEEKDLPGAVACIFSYEDPIVGAQITHAFGKTHPHVKFVGGLFEGKLLNKAGAITLATIPSRQVLLATFAGMIQSPLRSFMSICNGPLTGFARGLSEVAKKKAAAPAA